jgi:oligoendopeptidase F
MFQNKPGQTDKIFVMQNTSTALPKRNEIPLALTWDLTLVYKTEADWESDFKYIEKHISQLSSFAGTLENSAQTLADCLELRDETFRIFGKVRSYAHLKQSEDAADAARQTLSDRADMLGTRLAAASAFIEPQILEMSADKLRDFAAQDKRLAVYDYYFQTLERRRAHIRSAEVEDVLAQVSEPLGTASNAFGLFNNADLKFPKIKDENGNEVEMTKGRYIQFLDSPDRRVRADAFGVMHREYSRWQNTLAATLAGSVKADVFNARVRGYGSALEAALQPDEIPTGVYHNLISTVRERLPVLNRYLRLRKKLLNLQELQLWDLYVPMVQNADKPVSYDNAQHDVLAASHAMGREYSQTVQRAFDERWIDVPENEGKRSGAFSDGSYSTPPYILLNWQNKTNDAFTLAHELGHSLHSHFTRSSQPFVYGDYTIFVAEVASTLYEALLADHLISKARENNDRATQLYLLNEEAEKFRTTLIRQTMFAEFELKIHEAVERNEPLTAEGMSTLYLQLNQDYYGAEVSIDDAVKIEWARIPHFYYGFYVYQYATGISASAALAQDILSGNGDAVENYLQFLRGGSSDTSINLLKRAGVDMTTSAPIHAALDRFDAIIAQMEELAS